MVVLNQLSMSCVVGEVDGSTWRRPTAAVVVGESRLEMETPSQPKGGRGRRLCWLLLILDLDF